MGARYNTNTDSQNLLYDDSAFQFFFLAVLTVCWVPVAFSRFTSFLYHRFRKKTALEKAKEGWCSCTACKQKKAVQENHEKPSFFLPFWDIVFVVAGVLLVVVAYRVFSAKDPAEPPFDPFAILGVPTTATKRQIQKAYRRLSVVHHPDKNIGDPTAGDRFIKISKAFASLTDEVAKENYIKYGNPDGYIGTTLGLGLPQWVATSQNTVLFMYVLFMVLVFPILVGVWWNKRNKQLTDVVMKDTYALYCNTLQQSSKFRDILAAFASSFEFEGLHAPEHAPKLADLVHALKRANKMDVRKINFVMEPTQSQIQNIVILAARISRIPIPREFLPILNKMLDKAEPLLITMADTVGVFHRPECESAWKSMHPRGHTQRLAMCLRLMHCVFQGFDEKDPALLQMPHFTEREVKFCTTSRTIPARHIYDFMRLKTEEQRTLLRGFTDEQFSDVKKFCERYPHAKLMASDPIVEDEEDGSVHEGDTVTIRAKLQIVRKRGSVYSPHAPDLPPGKTEVWWVWLADQRLLYPLDVKRLLPSDARGHNPDGRKSDDDLWPGDEADDTIESVKDLRVTVFDLKFNFIAPKAGTYSMEILATVDCYNGCEKKHKFTMDVKEPVEPPPVDNVKYFDTDDEPSSSSEGESESDTNEDGESGSDASYEYIEVTDDEASEEGDVDDIVDITGPSEPSSAEDMLEKKNA